jgi:hypothetical protein
MKTKPKPQDDMRAEYDFDFSKAERGRYAKRIKAEGSNLVLLEPDLAKTFPDSVAVNAALRSVIAFAKLSADMTKQTTSKTVKRKAA